MVDNQLKMRQFDLKEIKEKAKTDASGLEPMTLTGKTPTENASATPETGTKK